MCSLATPARVVPSDARGERGTTRAIIIMLAYTTLALLTLLPNSPTKKSVLLTGATGFCGKVFLERLLAEEDDVESIHLLVRKKRGASAASRLLALQESAALRNCDLSRVSVVEGDLSEPLLGLTADTRESLTQSTTHIVNLAASVDFDLPIARAVESNVCGALSVLEFARACSHLKALVHCSTAYVSPASDDDSALLESDAPHLHLTPDIDAAAAYERIRTEGLSEATCARWLRESGHPNTYTLTKAMAEELLTQRRGDVPLCIVRPSIVSASLRHPSPGWIDSQAAFAAFVAMFGRGMLHSLCAEPNTPCDIVPVDYVADRLLTAAFSPSLDRASAPVLYAVAGRAHSLTISRIAEILVRHFEQSSCVNAALVDMGGEKDGSGGTARIIERDSALRPYLRLLAPASHPEIASCIQDDVDELRTRRDNAKAAGDVREATRFALLAKALSRLHEVFPHFHRTPYRFLAACPIDETLLGFDANSYVALAVRGIECNLIGGAEAGNPLRIAAARQIATVSLADMPCVCQADATPTVAQFMEETFGYSQTAGSVLLNGVQVVDPCATSVRPGDTIELLSAEIVGGDVENSIQAAH